MQVEMFDFFDMFTFFSLMVGCCVGSFANVVIHRFSSGKSIVTPRSHCFSCGTNLKWRDMIPVISWLMLKGRCRFCDATISKAYPIVEIVCALLFALMATYLGASLSVFPLWGLAFVLLSVAVIDWKSLTIPDGLLIVGVISGLIWVGLSYGESKWVDAFFGIIAGALPLFLIDQLVWILAKKPGFGFGDVKLMGMSGIFLGWQYVYIAFFVAFIMGGLWGAWLLITKKAQRDNYIAFGPFLCFGILVALLYSL